MRCGDFMALRLSTSVCPSLHLYLVGAALMDLLDECSGVSSCYPMLLDKTPE